MSKSDVAKTWNKALSGVIDDKAVPGSGRRTCMGGTLDNIHYVQAFLHPLYKNLRKIGVPTKKITEVHGIIDDMLEGLKMEFPEMFPGNDESGVDGEAEGEQSRHSDSDEQLIKHRSQALKGETERERWLKMKMNATEMRSLKFDVTPFWERSGRELFPGLALLYYRTATKHPSEALVERFFSVAGYITAPRRGRAGVQLTKATTMRHLWKL